MIRRALLGGAAIVLMPVALMLNLTAGLALTVMIRRREGRDDD